MVKLEDITEVFKSPVQFCNEITKRPVNSLFAGKQLSILENDRRTNFTTTGSFSIANDLFIHGDVANCKAIKDAPHIDMDKYKNFFQVFDLKKSVRRDVTGCVPCVAACLSGDPRNMMRVVKSPVKTNIAKIVLNCSYTYAVTTDDVKKAGVTMAAMINELEKANIRVELYAGCVVSSKPPMCTTGKQRLKLFVKIKDSGAPLNMLKIAYPIVNPSFSRRHVSLWMETLPEGKINKIFANGYGYCDYFEKDDMKGAIFIDIKSFLSGDGSKKIIEQIVKETFK